MADEKELRKKVPTNAERCWYVLYGSGMMTVEEVTREVNRRYDLRVQRAPIGSALDKLADNPDRQVRRLWDGERYWYCTEKVYQDALLKTAALRRAKELILDRHADELREAAVAMYEILIEEERREG